MPKLSDKSLIDEGVKNLERSSYPHLRGSVLKWLDSLCVGTHNYNFAADIPGNIFSSIFALYILDLFNEVKNLTTKEKADWSHFINNHQDENSGLFIPENYNGPFISKTVLQLTSFALSALAILESEPIYELHFQKNYQTLEKVEEYLIKNGCTEGMPKSGNMAMFLAIFLTHQYEKEKNPLYLELIIKWFDVHDRSQNPITGFWGNNDRKNTYLGFQNALHQFIIYNYWERKINYHEQIVDNILQLQSNIGFFAPYYGGSSCYEYDAVDILVNCGLSNKYRVKNIRNSLHKLYKSLLNSQNDDGGFPESKMLGDTWALITNREFIHYLLEIKKYNIINKKLRTNYSAIRDQEIKIHWHTETKPFNKSYIWDTWFKCLAIGLMECQVFNYSSSNWKFQNHIGLGFIKNSLR